MSALGARLREAREERGWSQMEASWHCNTTPQVIHRWESGERRPTIKSLVGLAVVYELSVAELVELWR